MVKNQNFAFSFNFCQLFPHTMAMNLGYLKNENTGNWYM